MQSGGIGFTGSRSEDVGAQLVAKAQRVLTRDRFFVRPHGNSRSGDTEGISKGLLGSVGRDGIALENVHAAIVRPLTPTVNTLTAAKRKITDMEKMPLSERARSARVRAGFENEAAAARAIGCSRPLVISWENGGAKSIGGKYLMNAARAYKVRPEWLLGSLASDGYPTDVETLPRQQSQVVRLDPEILIETARTLRERFGDAGMVCYLIENDPDRFIEAYMLYADHTSDERTPEQERALAMKIADLTPKGAGKDERGPKVPVEGTSKRKVGSRRGRKA